MKFNIRKYERWPYFGLCELGEVYDISEERVKWIDRVTKEFKEVQKFLKQVVEKDEN